MVSRDGVFSDGHTLQMASMTYTKFTGWTAQLDVGVAVGL
jgi:hypothetical protein